MDQIKQEIDKGEKINFTKLDVPTIASLIKQYVRELPAPLVNVEVFEAYMANSNSPSGNHSWLAQY